MLFILWNSMTLTSFVFTGLANTMKDGGEVLYNLVFTEWRHCVPQNEVLGRGSYITLFPLSGATKFHRIAETQLSFKLKCRNKVIYISIQIITIIVIIWIEI